MHRALRLPEIVAEILSHIPNGRRGKSSLLACVKVNKLWADEATSFLWSRDVPIEALAALHLTRRLRYYSAKVRILCFEGDDNRHHNHLANGNFCRLRNLEIIPCHDTSAQDLKHYLQPQLRRLEILGGQISDAFLRNVGVSIIVRFKSLL